MVHIDYKNGTLNRTLKTSATFFKRLTKTRVVPKVKSGSQPFPDDSGSGDDSGNGSASTKTSVIMVIVSLLAIKLMQ